MIIFKKISALQHHLDSLKSSKKAIGFVPTMGALHDGHLLLVQQSKTVCEVTVVSIFVNPTQFNDLTDFEKYPVTIEKDCLQLEQQHADILFLPSVTEMYPEGMMNQKPFDLGILETVLDGHYRPGHFQGVCQVVKRLLDIVQPKQLFLGQKDYQQCKVIQRLITVTGINASLVIVPTQREKDGLAMSSRNVRLTDEQRLQATAIYQQLIHVRDSVGTVSPLYLTQQATAALLHSGFSKVDYVAIADAESLEPLQSFSDNKKAIALIAAFIGNVRLIDNMLLR